MGTQRRFDRIYLAQTYPLSIDLSVLGFLCKSDNPLLQLTYWNSSTTAFLGSELLTSSGRCLNPGASIIEMVLDIGKFYLFRTMQ